MDEPQDVGPVYEAPRLEPEASPDTAPRRETGGDGG